MSLIINPYRYGGGPTDPYWSNVVSYIPFIGPNNSTTFVDETGKTWLPHGNAKLSTSAFAAGAGSFDGSGDYIDTGDLADWDFAAGAFTVEAYARFAAAPVSGNSTIISKWSGTAGQEAWALFMLSGVLYFRFADSGGTLRDTGAAFSPTVGADYHIAADRDGSGVVRVYVNGAVIASNTFTQLMRSSPSGVLVGQVQGYAGTFDFNGLLRHLRVTKGVARYAGAFTPPSVPYLSGPPTAPAISATRAEIDTL